MIKNKLDFKLINFAIIMLIIFLIYMTGNLWLGILSKIVAIFTPFLLAFALAYALYPFLQKLQKRKLPKWLGVSIIVFIILSIIALVIYVTATMMFGQLSNLFNSILKFIESIQDASLDLNLAGLESTLSDTFKGILSGFGDYVSNGAVVIIDSSLGILSNVLIIFASFIYFLVDMEKIREEVRFFFEKKTKKLYLYIKTLDNEMKKYLSGLIQIMLISVVEYTLIYTIIGHPNAILLGFLASLANLIPYFGGIGVNIIAAITAFVVSPALLIRTIIAFVILSTVDGYVISPTVYGKTNSLHPLVIILALFSGGILFGIQGVFISFPLAIIIVTTYKYFKDDIARNIKRVKVNKESDTSESDVKK